MLWLKVCTDYRGVWRQSCVVWQTFRLTSELQTKARIFTFLSEKEKQTGRSLMWSKAVRKYYKCWLTHADKSVSKCISQAAVNAWWRLFKPRPDNKCFNLRGESETQDMEKWKQSSQDTEDGVRRSGETLLDVVLAGSGHCAAYFSCHILRFNNKIKASSDHWFLSAGVYVRGQRTEGERCGPLGKQPDHVSAEQGSV